MKRKLGTAILAAALVAAGSYGGLVSVDWQSGGDGLLTHDTETGLEWLDLTQTLDQSLSSISPLLSAGNTYDGFRVATSNEVISLLNGAGISPIPTSTSDPVVFASATALTSLLGETMQPAFPDNYFGSRGLASEGDLYGYYSANGVDLNTQILSGVTSHPTVGVWLVRDAIPEPSTIAFVGIFGSGLLLIRRFFAI